MNVFIKVRFFTTKKDGSTGPTAVENDGPYFEIMGQIMAPIGAVCSGSTLFASILNLSVMLGNFLQQTTSADDVFRCIFCA